MSNLGGVINPGFSSNQFKLQPKERGHWMSFKVS